MLSLIAAGASAPVLFDQFISEKEGNALVAVVDPGGVWSLCHGVTVINGKPVIKGQRATEELCKKVNAVERDKALAWVQKNIHVPLTEPQKVGIASFCPYNIGLVNVSPPRSTSASMLVTVKVHVKQSAGGLKTVAATAG
jgi:lysozyme